MKFFCSEEFYNFLNEDPDLDAYLRLYTQRPKNYDEENERAKANYEGVIASRKNTMLVLKALQHIYEPGKQFSVEVLKTFNTYSFNGKKFSKPLKNTLTQKSRTSLKKSMTSPIFNGEKCLNKDLLRKVAKTPFRESI